MAPLTFRDIHHGLCELGLTSDDRLLVFASLPALGPVRGGAETVAGALASVGELVVMPVFTPQCQVWPLAGPPDNGVAYGDHADENAQADFFRPDLPAQPSQGAVAEALRRAPGALRSSHPLYSFTAIGAEAELALAAQSLAEPLGPIAHLAESGRVADVLLLGVDHTSNAALHYAAGRAGGKLFVRWALTAAGIVECPACPGCGDGFNRITPHIRGLGRVAHIGTARAERLPLRAVTQAAVDLLRRDPTALLCSRAGCERCAAVRRAAEQGAIQAA
jgi:aminoglycoside 3-N-acetyltransferase